MPCRQTHATLGTLLCCAAAVFSGCYALPPDEDAAPASDGATAMDPTAPGQEQANVTSSGFMFAEDADPAMAALPFVEDELLVRSLPGAEAEELRAAYAEVGATLIQDLPEIETAVLHVRRSARQADSCAVVGCHYSVRTPLTE